MSRKTLTEQEKDRLEDLIHAVDSTDKLKTLEALIHLAGGEHNIEKLEDIIRNHDTLVSVADKENKWIWLRKTMRDVALWFLAVSAAIYGIYELWLRVVANTVNKLNGGS